MLRRFTVFSRGASFLFLLLLLSVAKAQTPVPNQSEPASVPNTPPSGSSTALVPTASPSNLSAGAADSLSYRIGPGDELDIRVFGRSELSRVVRVDNLGKIRLPFLDEIQAACLTEAEVSAALMDKYKKYLRDPQIDVLVKDFRSQPVAVIGAVTQPGRFQLQRRVRLLELITFAGGPQTRAGSSVHIIHNSENNFCSQNLVTEQAKDQIKDQASPNGESKDADLPMLSSIKLRDVLAGVPDANPFVQPGDIVSIPEADQFFVTGSVIKPGAFSLLNKTTLTQAIALAGGINMEGTRSRVRVIREEVGKGIRKETVYNLDDIYKRKIQDLVLMPNDIIEVPSSTMRVASRNILGVGINMLSTLPYFVIR